MRRLVRWLRGALSIGVTWAVLWALLGTLLFILFKLFQPEDIDPGEALGDVLPVFAFIGLLSGLGFAALLSLAERRHQVSALSLRRVALWGALGSASIPLMLGAMPADGLIFSVLGAGFAAGSVAIARRGSLEAIGPGEAGEPDSTTS